MHVFQNCCWRRRARRCSEVGRRQILHQLTCSFHASFSSVTGENRDGELSGVTVALGSEVGVETHPGVGGDDSGEWGRPHNLASSLQARTTADWFSKKGTK